MKTKNTQDVSKRTTNGLLVSALMAGFLTVSATASAASQAQAPTSNKASTQKSSITAKEQAAAEAEQAAAEENEEAEDGLQQPVEQDNQLQQDNNQGEQDIAEAQGQEPAQAQSAVNSAPRLAGEAGGNVEATPITLQQKIKDKRGELQATQPGQVEVQESRHIRAQ